MPPRYSFNTYLTSSVNASLISLPANKLCTCPTLVQTPNSGGRLYGGVPTDDGFINSAFKIWKQALDMCKLYQEGKGRTKAREPSRQDYITISTSNFPANYRQYVAPSEEAIQVLYI
jgi:hypothetical protein